MAQQLDAVRNYWFLNSQTLLKISKNAINSCDNIMLLLMLCAKHKQIFLNSFSLCLCVKCVNIYLLNVVKFTLFLC